MNRNRSFLAACLFWLWLFNVVWPEKEYVGLDLGLSTTAAQDWTAPSPNPRGWGGGESELPITRRPERFSESFVSDSVRQQIGLATYQEPVPEPANQSQLGSPPPGLVESQPSLEEGWRGNLTGGDAWISGLPEPRELFLSPTGIQSTLRFSLLISALSLAPAIVLMTTCYIRVIVVLSLLKQAFGGQQLPPTQVITALSLFLTFLIMAPVWHEVKTNSIDPYAAEEISWDEAWNRGIAPVKNFMARQIAAAGNERSIDVFYQYAPGVSPSQSQDRIPDNIEEVPINLLIPAFMISELKIAFLLGFQIFLPFLVLDLVVSSVAVSMGMFMLPPHLISFPLKLILFVLVDGWSLVVGMLLQSFA